MTFQTAAEDHRQEAADDAKFFRSLLYFFELRVPAKALGSAAKKDDSFLFPLVVNPDAIAIIEPFALQDTPGADGGLVIEENGIIRRMLTLRGTTGWKPRPHMISQGFGAIKFDDPSWQSRGQVSALALSGQRHFHFLQDKVFRTYGDLKRDPSTAAGTSLIFHNTKDDEHWLVAPREFRMERDASRPLEYRYAIELLVVDKAQPKDPPIFVEDKSLLDKIKDGVTAVRNAVDQVIGAIKDVIRFVKDLENFVQGIGNTINRISGFINSVSDLVSGAADLIASPFSAVANITSTLETSLNRLVSAPFAAIDTIAASFRKMQDAFDTFAVHPELFEDDTRTKLRAIRAGGELTTSVSRSALNDAAANPATSLRALAKSGTRPLAGDLDRSRAERGQRNEPVFLSAEQYTIGQDDTLSSIAAKFLGDARRWRQIAVLNDLRSPFISSQGLPRTKRPGDRLLVPSTARAPQAITGAAVIGARPSEELADRLLGRDLRLIASPRDARRFDLAIDTTKGSTDARTIAGIENIVQAIRFRVLVEQGSDLLFTSLGVRRMVGLSIPVVDTEILRLRISEAVANDPRISAVRSTRLSAGTSADAVEVELDAGVRGFDDPLLVNATTAA